MAQKTIRTAPRKSGKSSPLTKSAAATNTFVKAPHASPAPSPAHSEEAVVFTSFDGTVREVGDLPLPLGRATALAGEKTLAKIWGDAREEEACHNMQKEM